MNTLTARHINLAAFGVCAALLAYAYYLQFVDGLEPCPLCIFQRAAFIGLGAVFLVAGLHAPVGRGFRWFYTGVLGLFALGGAGIAGRHVWLQNLPADQVPACGPGLEYMLDVFPLTEALEMAFTGSGECAEVDWAFLGLSMPWWTLLWYVILGAVAVWANRFRPARG